jgi:hypothetical protein
MQRDRVKSQIVENMASMIPAPINTHNEDITKQFSTVEQQICVEIDTGIITKMNKPKINPTLSHYNQNTSPSKGMTKMSELRTQSI